MIFDTHAHYDDEAFDKDRDELLGRLLAEGGVECVVNMGASMEGAETSAALAEKYSKNRYETADNDAEIVSTTVLAGIGIHPDDVMSY